MKKKLLFIAFVVCFILLIISCHDNEEPPATIKVGYLPMVSSLAHFVALDKGYYKEEGLN